MGRGFYSSKILKVAVQKITQFRFKKYIVKKLVEYWVTPDDYYSFIRQKYTMGKFWFVKDQNEKHHTNNEHSYKVTNFKMKKHFSVCLYNTNIGCNTHIITRHKK